MARRRSNNRGGCTSGRAVPWRVGKPASQGRRLRNSLDWYHAAEADAGRAGSMQGEIGTFVTHSAAWAGLFEWRLRRRNVGGLGEAAEGGCAYTRRKDGSEALCPTENFGTSASVFHERPASPCQQPRSKPSHSSSFSPSSTSTSPSTALPLRAATPSPPSTSSPSSPPSIATFNHTNPAFKPLYVHGNILLTLHPTSLLLPDLILPAPTTLRITTRHFLNLRRLPSPLPH